MGEILWVTEPTALRDLLNRQIGVPGVVTGNKLAFLIKDIDSGGLLAFEYIEPGHNESVKA